MFLLYCNGGLGPAAFSGGKLQDLKALSEVITMAIRTQSSLETVELANAMAMVMAAEAQARLLADGAISDLFAPKSLTGCVSALSSCERLDAAYTAALKNYGETYEQFQDYLAPADVLSEHDYDQAIAMSMPEGAHLGCLNDEVVEFPALNDISEEEIEHCGYMGWLRH